MTERRLLDLAQHNPAGYVKGCRCDECSEAHAAYNRDYQERMIA